MTDEQKKQFTLRISQANKSELVIILYDMFGVFIGDAGDLLSSLAYIGDLVEKAVGIVGEIVFAADAVCDRSDLGACCVGVGDGDAASGLLVVFHFVQPAAAVKIAFVAVLIGNDFVGSDSKCQFQAVFILVGAPGH